MTEVARWAPEQPTFTEIRPRELSLVEWAREADAALQLAQTLCRSPFAPPQFRDNPDHTAAAILAGSELSLSPTAAMQAFDVIEHRAAPRAITLRALAQAHGHELIVTTSTENTCVMKGRRRGSNEWQEVTWTIARARRLGVAGKRNWNTQPTAMLVARATSELARLVAADALLGIPYSAEELRDELATDEAAGGTRKVKRRRVVVAPDPAETEDAADDAAEPVQAEADPGAEPATGADLRALGAAFVRAGIRGGPERTAYASEVLGHEVFGATELTAAEARRVVEALAVMPEPDTGPTPQQQETAEQLITDLDDALAASPAAESNEDQT